MASLLAGLMSVVLELTSTVLVMFVRSGRAASDLTTRMNSAVAPMPSGKLVFVEVMVPVPPTPGVVEVQPFGAVNDTNVVPVGTLSVRTGIWAGFGPLLVKSMV